MFDQARKPAIPDMARFAPSSGQRKAVRPNRTQQGVAKASWLNVGFFLSCLLAGGFSLGEGLYVSQLLLVAFLAWKIFVRRDRSTLGRLGGSVAVIAFLGIWSWSAGATSGERFIPEFFKTVLLVMGAMILWGEIGWKDLAAISKVFPPIAVGIVTFVIATDQGDYYGFEGRFGVPWWGSPNTTAFVLCMAIALWLFEMHSRLTTVRTNAVKGLVLGLEATVLLALGAAVVYTNSQGGEIAMAVILLRYAGMRLRVLGYLLPFAVLAYWVLGVQVPELIGSGRPIIWQTLLEEQYSASFVHWIFGFGPGSIDFTPWFTARVLSAHSMFVEVLYNWGVFVGAAFVIVLWRYSKRVSDAPLSDLQRYFIEASFAGLIAGFFFDTYVMAAQLSWLGAFVLASGGALPKTFR